VLRGACSIGALVHHRGRQDEPQLVVAGHGRAVEVRPAGADTLERGHRRPEAERFEEDRADGVDVVTACSLLRDGEARAYGAARRSLLVEAVA
jgi:hypothetical protein